MNRTRREKCKRIWEKGEYCVGVMKGSSLEVLAMWGDDVKVPDCKKNEDMILFHTHPASSGSGCASDLPSTNDIFITLTTGYRKHMIFAKEGIYILEPVVKMTNTHAQLVNFLYEIDKKTEEEWCPMYQDPKQICDTINILLEGFIKCHFVSWDGR